MQFDKQCKIHKGATTKGGGRYAKGGGRYAMGFVDLEIDDDRKARLIATDGRILAVVPVEVAEDDVAGLLPADALKQAVANTTRKAPTARVDLNGSIRVHTKSGVVEHERDDDAGEFPKWQQVVPKGDVVHRIALNPQCLIDVASAIGAGDSVVLEYREEGGPLVVRPGSSLDGGTVTAEDFASRFGVLMPITLKTVVPEDAPLTAGVKAARTRKRRQLADLELRNLGPKSLTDGERAIMKKLSDEVAEWEVAA